MHDLNPLGSAGSWELSVVLGLATWSYAVLSTLASQKSMGNIGSMALAIVVITVAVVLNMAISAPGPGEYGRFDYTLVVGLAVAAALLQGLSSRGGEASLVTDWGPLVVAGILAAASSFRPRTDQLVAGCAATVLIGAQKTIESLDRATPFGSVYFVVTAVAPIVIVTIGQSAYTGFAIRSLLAWQRGFDQTQSDVTSLAGLGAARKIGQDFLAEFSVEVQPLLSKILRSGRITKGDSEVAAIAVERIRSRLVTLSNETWIERLGVSVADPERVSENLDLPARAAIAALLGGLALHAVTNVMIEFRSSSSNRPLNVTITGDYLQSRFLLRTQLAPIFRVLYIVFFNVIVAHGATSMTLKFDYGVE